MVKQVLKFTSPGQKVMPDDFPDDPDQRYTTFTFVEDKALIASVIDLRNKKVIKSSIITVYELFKALGFSSIYHSVNFSLLQRTYSYKKDRLFLKFNNDFDYLDENQPEHHRMLLESRNDPSKPHVYMLTQRAIALMRPYSVVIEGVSDLSKRRIRVISNSFESMVAKPGKDEICMIYASDFENKAKFEVFNESTGEEKSFLIKKTSEVNNSIDYLYKVDQKHYVLVDSNNLYLADLKQGKILSTVQYKRNFILNQTIEDGNTIVCFEQRSCTVDVYQFDDKSTRLRHLYKVNLQKQLKGFNLFKIEKILGMKKMTDKEVLLLIRVSILPYKSRGEFHDGLLEAKLPLGRAGQLFGPGQYALMEVNSRLSPTTGAQLLIDRLCWKIISRYPDGVLLSDVPSRFLKKTTVGRTLSPPTIYLPPENENVKIDDYYYWERVKDDKKVPYLFLFFEKVGGQVGRGQEGQGEREIQNLDERDEDEDPNQAYKILSLFEIEDSKVIPGQKGFKRLASVEFHKDAQLSVSKRLENPYFSVHEKYSREGILVNHLQVFDGDLKVVSRFDLSEFLFETQKKWNFTILNEYQLLARLKKKSKASAQEQIKGGETYSQQQGESEREEEVYQTVLFDTRRNTRRLLKNPRSASGEPLPQDVSSTPLMFTGDRLICYRRKGFKSTKMESNDLYYYDLRPRSTSWLGSLYIESLANPALQATLLAPEE